MASGGGVQELLACQISAWYPSFARVTFKTAILPLPPAVADWLVSDGLHLAPDSQAFAKRGQLEEYPDEDDYQDWSEDGSEAGGSGSEAAPAQPPPPELEQLKAQVQAAIEELGGRVVPKLSWSCPKDAVWMSPSSSLACTNADEVLLLLRASDRVAHDICHALAEAAAATVADASGTDASPAAGAEAGKAVAAAVDGAAAGSGNPAPAAVQHCLALRRWYDLQPGREFRCFVRGQALVGASQRDLTQCFEFLKEAKERRELAEAICAFHAKHVQGRFLLPDYTYDVYVATSGAVRLLDFNPVGGTTAPLLFGWEELGLGGSGAGGAAAAAAAAAEAAGGAAAGAAGSAGEAAMGAAVAACGQGSSAAEQPAAAAACCRGTCEVQPEAGAGGAVAEEPSYLEQLRRVQALSLSEQQQGSGAAGVAAEQQQAQTHAQQAQQQAQQAQQQPRQQLELRVIEEPVALRPHTLAYGVPFDFVDSREGSALERLMAQTQQAGAQELWAALAAQSGGNGGES